MLKSVNFESLHDDLRKVGITFVIGGLMGLFIRPHNEIIPLSLVTILGLIIWYLGLTDGKKNPTKMREIYD